MSDEQQDEKNNLQNLADAVSSPIVKRKRKQIISSDLSGMNNPQQLPDQQNSDLIEQKVIAARAQTTVANFKKGEAEEEEAFSDSASNMKTNIVENQTGKLTEVNGIQDATAIVNEYTQVDIKSLFQRSGTGDAVKGDKLFKKNKIIDNENVSRLIQDENENKKRLTAGELSTEGYKVEDSSIFLEQNHTRQSLIMQEHEESVYEDLKENSQTLSPAKPSKLASLLLQKNKGDTQSLIRSIVEEAMSRSSQNSIKGGGSSKKLSSSKNGRSQTKRRGKTNLGESGIDRSQSMSGSKLVRSFTMQKTLGRSASMLSEGPLGRSMAGFEMGQGRPKESFFSQLRQKSVNQSMNVSQIKRESQKMKGKQFLEKISAQQKEYFEKKFAFERGQYHQCIPNPLKPDQRITVQLVERVLDESMKQQKQGMVENFFSENQSRKAQNVTISQIYERYNLISPDSIQNLDDMGEGENSNDSNSSENLTEEDLKAKSQIKSGVYGQQDSKLYTPKRLFRDVDKLLGIQNQHYANIQKSKSNLIGQETRQDCKEFAVVAFWDLHKTDVFVCTRFFIVPNPIKRIVKDSNGTIVNQVLFTSQHTNDVFFFWKGVDPQKRKDLDESAESIFQEELQIAFLKLRLNADEIEQIGEERQLTKHCKDLHVINEDSIVYEYLKDMQKPLREQKQSPNPTIIYAIQDDNFTSSFKQAATDQQEPKISVHSLASLSNKTLQFQNQQEPTKRSKYLIFTAHLLEKQLASSRLPQIFHTNRKIVQSNWYPTVYFYDLRKQLIVWQVYGGEQFIAAQNHNVTILTNEIWYKLKENEYRKKLEGKLNQFTRHDDYNNFVMTLQFGSRTRDQDFSNMGASDEKAPEPTSLKQYRLTFNMNKNLAITEGSKVISSYMHQNGKRVTLLYSGLGAYTFQLKDAISLLNKSLWHGKYKNDQTFNCQLQFNRNGLKAEGSGKTDTDADVNVSVALSPKESAHWMGFYEQGEVVEELTIQELCFDPATMTVSAEWEDNGLTYQLSGHYEHKKRKQGTQLANDDDVSFKLLINQDQPILFKGTVDALQSCIRGKCTAVGSHDYIHGFSFELAEPVEGIMSLTIAGELQDPKVIVMDYQTKMIRSREGVDQEIELNAIEAIDQAEITYAIMAKDVTYLELDSMAHIQAKFTARADEDATGNGMGVAETDVILYNIDSQTNKHDKQHDTKEKKAVGEPKNRTTVNFYVNQSYLRTQEKNDTQMWYIGLSTIQPASNGVKARIFGSVLYAEYPSGDIRLNMWSANINTEKDSHSGLARQDKLFYQQEPVPQSWIVDYPLLAYKTFTPRNKEIAIIHMAYNMPQRLIHLGDWEFVCFVNHTQMVEQKCFKKQKETNCDIMLLVKRTTTDAEGRDREMCRLLSFKSNPWLQYHENVKLDGDLDIVKQAFYIFSGDIGVIPTEDMVTGEKIAQGLDEHIKFKQRYNNDKIQTCQLITKRLGGYEQYMLIIQFNDCIVQASLNRNFFKLICQPENMIRRHLVRGYNEKIYFAESSGNVDKIFQVEFHPSKPNEITKYEIYQLSGGKLAAFEYDGECIQNDMNEEGCAQSMFIMDDSQKIYLLQNTDNVRFRQKKIIDFSRHNKAKEVNLLLQNDWAHVHVTERTLTMEDKTYNLATQLSMKVSIPKNYFGKESSRQVELDDDLDSDRNSSEEVSDDEDKEQEQWQISSVQGMSMTTNMIVVAERNQKEFCFCVKPAPGSRKINIVGFQQLHEIEQMLFVTNSHVLLNFRGGKSITLLANGSIIHQESRVQEQLEKSERVIGESQLYQGKKTVLLEDEYGENNEKVRHIALRFAKRGAAQLVGVFQDYKEQIDQIFERRKKIIDQEFEMERQNLKKDGKSGPGYDTQKINPERLSSDQSIDLAAKEKLVKDAIDSAQNSVIGQINSFDFVPSIQIPIKKKAENVIKYAKEFFVTERGEVIKMGAIISPNAHIRGKLLAAREAQKLRKEKKALSGTIEINYISIFKIDDRSSRPDASLQASESETSAFTVIIFHTLDEEIQNEFVSNTQYCVVGNYLCHRRRNKQEIWVSKLKQNVDELIQDQKKVAEDKAAKMEDFYKEYRSVCINIDKMTRKVMLPHIQLTEVPKAYFTTIKARKANQTNQFYDNLLQITIGTNGMIYDLDSLMPFPHEVDSIEAIDQLMKPDTYVNTGFIMSISHNASENGIDFRKRIQIFTNEYQNLLFEKQQSRYDDGSARFKISGMLYRTFSEIDLQELRQIQASFDQRLAKINPIDPEAILCNFEGHTIFSIFFDRVLVYEQVLKQLIEMEFEDEDDINGEDRECSKIRRLYRILNIPTADLANFKDKHNVKSETANASCGSRFTKAICCKKDQELHVFESKAICRKSMYFKNSRFRDILMEIALLCRENAINNFVENIDDIEVLFTSMSPSTVKLFENGFKTTRHTEAIKNADWRQGDTLEVIGSQSSVMMEKDANQMIVTRQKKLFQAEGNVQNRQIEAKMLQIDWIFADCGDKTKVGFADLVVALANAPHESLFSTQLIKTLCDHFWGRYYRAVIIKCFIPFFMYLISTLLYISNFTIIGVDSSERWNFTTNEFWNRIAMIVLTAYFIFFEIKSIIRDGIGYFKEMFNYLDILSFTCNIYCLQVAQEGIHAQSEDSSRIELIRSISALAVLLMWFKAFYWLRMFGPTSFFVRMIQETLYDIRYFLILFILILLTFGNAILILSQGREENDQEPLFKDYFANSYLNVVLNQYELSLGEFDTDDRFRPASEGGDSIAWLTFIGATLITQIMFLNMLIAIMGDTFERVTESREQSALVEKIRILADYVYVVPYETEASGTMNKFLFQLRPLTLGQDEMGSWEGTATMLRNVVETNISQATKAINTKMSQLSGEVADGYKKINLLEERMAELHGSSQRQQGMIFEVLQELRKMRRGHDYLPDNGAKLSPITVELKEEIKAGTVELSKPNSMLPDIHSMKRDRNKSMKHGVFGPESRQIMENYGIQTNPIPFVGLSQDNISGQAAIHIEPDENSPSVNASNIGSQFHPPSAKSRSKYLSQDLDNNAI